MNDNLLLVLTVFVGLCTLSMVVQALVMIGLYGRFKALQQQIAAFTPKIEEILTTTQKTLEQSRQQIAEVTTKANAILDSTKVQLGRVEEVLVDATTRAKSQIERVDLVLEDAITRVHETVTMLHKGVLRPLREINGVTAGVRAAIQTLLTGKRPSVAQATHDEEMFI